MYTLRFKTIIAMVLTLIIFIAFTGSTLAQEAEPSDPKISEYLISDIALLKKGNELSITIKGNVSPLFTHYELPDPQQRLIVDIAEASFGDAVGLPLEVGQGPVTSISGKMLTEKMPAIARLEIFLSGDSPYTVVRVDNEIIVTFSENSEQEAPAGAIAEQMDSMKSPGEIYRVELQKSAHDVTILLVGDGPINNFSKEELPAESGSPDRIYIDLPGVKAPGVAKEISVQTAGLARVRVAERKEGLRVVFDSALNQLFDYKISPDPEGLSITIGGEEEQQRVSGTSANTDENKIMAEKTRMNDISVDMVGSSDYDDEFVGAGYNQQRISVDFYKTDIHNVFRLVHEISGLNVIVDEGISGQLTLALEEVPWDFLLDVVLNLKELQKEERYNTLVISKKSKEFTWPERVIAEEDKEGDEGDEDSEDDAEKEYVELSEEDKSYIEEQRSLPPEVFASKLAMKQGGDLIAEGKLREGVDKYVEAFDLWSDNIDLAKRIAGISLVDIGDNERAVAYAKKALGIDPEDMEAALQAAVGLAKMQDPEAKEYFALATSKGTPAREALLSYAAYQEESGDLGGAVETLQRFEEDYEPTIETRSSKARIFDKMGMPEKALKEYRSLLVSGKAIDLDFAQYIRGRIALDNKQ